MSELVINKSYMDFFGNPFSLLVISINNMGKSVGKFFKREQIINELSQLNDSQLADIGINRCDILRIANETVR